MTSIITIPDLYVEIGSEQQLWEVQTVADLPRFAARTALLSEGLPKFGFTYRVVTDKELAAQPRLANCQRLLSFGRAQVSTSDREIVRQLLLKTGTFTWEHVQLGLIGPVGRSTVSRLVLDGMLTFDSACPICASTRFFLRNEVR